MSHGCVTVLVQLLSEGAMAMMALEGLEKILQAGEERAGNTGTVNEHAMQVDASRIAELQAHKSTAIAKKASRLWKQFFDTCALCSRSMAKLAPAMRWCPECKCNVCLECDCSVYHLTYQSALWREASEEESAAKEQRAASRRSKRVKKRRKNKEKRTLTRQLQDASVLGIRPPLDDAGRPPSGREAPAEGGGATSDEAGPQTRDGSPTPTGRIAAGASTRPVQPPVSRALETSASEPAVQRPCTGPSCAPAAAARRVGVTRRAAGGANALDNDCLVEFLQQTGSIIALAEMLDGDQDDYGGDTV